MSKKTLIFFCLALFAISLSSNVFAEGENLLKNGSFESEQGGSPTDWIYEAHMMDGGATEFKIETEGAYSESKYVTIINNVENDARFLQAVKVEPNKKYKLSCMIKAENVSESGKGANLSVGCQLTTSKEIRNTNENWEYVEMYVETGKDIDTFNVTVGVGGYSSLSTGKASFDDVKIEEVDSIPSGAPTALFAMPDNDNTSSKENNQSNQSGSDGLSKVVWIVLAIAVLVVVVAAYSTFRSPSSSKNASSPDDKTDEFDENDEEPDADEIKVEDENRNESDDTKN